MNQWGVNTDELPSTVKDMLALWGNTDNNIIGMTKQGPEKRLELDFANNNNNNNNIKWSYEELQPIIASIGCIYNYQQNTTENPEKLDDNNNNKEEENNNKEENNNNNNKEETCCNNKCCYCSNINIGWIKYDNSYTFERMVDHHNIIIINGDKYKNILKDTANMSACYAEAAEHRRVMRENGVCIVSRE
eukprot:Tbor_TRINITY_DN6122_c5_g2::TRINITY_DN6122_c5_g2_i16::g.22812::m.22812